MASETPNPEDSLKNEDQSQLVNLQGSLKKVREELSKVIIGQDKVIDQLILAILSRGHCLLEGVPGLAKTLMISSLAKTFRLDFSRVQFTPDLMPADITGTEVIQEDKATGKREFKFLPGPIFANLILADEINRTPPKTQAALLEAMQEKQVTIGGQRHQLPNPFFVLATQNPIEQEGTYTLPEAQQDRFMFKVLVDYPSYEEEYQVADQTTATAEPELTAQLSAEEIEKGQELVRRIPVPPHVLHYALRLVRSTRVAEEDAPDYAKDLLAWGAGPRAVQFLVLGGKARAVIDGRSSVTIEDVQSVAHPVLRHRLITTFNADSEGITSDKVVDQLLEKVAERRDSDEVASEFKPAFHAA